MVATTTFIPFSRWGLALFRRCIRTAALTLAVAAGALVSAPGALARSVANSPFGWVACPGVRQCTAVEPPNIEITFDPVSGRENAAGPRAYEPDDDQMVEPGDLACPSLSQCTVADDEGSETTFNPVTGRDNALRTANITPYYGNDLGFESISCPATALCAAVPNDPTAFDPLTGALTSTGTIGGRAANVVNADPGLGVTVAVACPSIAQCTAFVADGAEVTYDPTSGVVNAIGVRHLPFAPQSALGLTFVELACPTASQCTAISDGREITFDPVSGMPNRLALHKVLPNDRMDPFGLSCPSARQCTAVDATLGHGSGFTTRERTFDPETGRERPMATLNTHGFDAHAVACPSLRQCTVVGGVGPGEELTFDPQARRPGSKRIRTLA